MDRPYGEFYVYYDLAALYAFGDERVKALDNLKVFNQKMEREIIGLWKVTQIKNDPLLDNIRDEPEFQKIVGEMEARYQAERERVRQWLEENDML